MSDLFILAGEMSGDTLGEKLLSSLYEIAPDLEVSGVGGPKMRALGLRSFLPMEELQTMGFLDLIPSLPRLYQLFQKIKWYLLENPPKAIVFIDYPGFNLRMARALMRKKSPSKRIQYVCPSVWAWGKGRIPIMEQSLDQLLSLLPFEREIFTRRKLDVKYIGHPIVQKVDEHIYDQNWRRVYDIPPGKPLLSLFPGSRKKEIVRNFPTQVAVLQEFCEEQGDFILAVSCADRGLLPLLKKDLSPQIKIIDHRHNYEQMRDSHLAIATSGTVALELALHEIPTIVTFAIHPIDTLIAYYLFRIRLPHYSLPNIIGEGEIFPELFGARFTKDRLVAKLREFLLSQVKWDACKRACSKVRKALGAKKANRIAAHAILEMIER